MNILSRIYIPIINHTTTSARTNAYPINTEKLSTNLLHITTTLIVPGRTKPVPHHPPAPPPSTAPAAAPLPLVPLCRSPLLQPLVGQAVATHRDRVTAA